MKSFSRALVLVLPVLLAGSARAAEESDTLLWKEELRAFLHDGPGWLLTAERRDALLAVDEEERQAWVDSFLAEDPDTQTEVNELIEGIDRRRRLVESTLLSFLDVRSRLLFVHGSPVERILVSCDQTFVPIEVWWYGDPKASQAYVLYEPEPDAPYRLWLPVDSKRVLYHHEMEYWLEQVAEIRGFGRGPRFDKTLCKQTKLVDEATGVKGLFDYEKGRPTNEEILAIVSPPDDLRVWARAAALTPLSDITRLRAGDPEVFFPELDRGRMLVRLLVRIPAEAGLEVYEDNEKRQLRVKVEGVVERLGETFEEFHMRFQVPVEGEAEELALILDRRLRPEEVFLVRLRIIDEISEAETTKAIAFMVPSDPVPHEDDLPTDILVVHGADFQPEKAAKADSLFLIPPETDVVLGLWKAETLITGAGIVKVAFFLDGKQQFARSRPPFHAELRLSKYPTEHIIRVEGYDAQGELLAWDEAVLNQQRGRLELRIIEPTKGSESSGPTLVRAGIVVPEEKRVERVEFLVNDDLRETLTKPPWQATLDLPKSSSAAALDYVTVTVLLDDGTRAEDVRFLSQPDYLEEVDVDFVELYTSVDGDSARSLQQTDFTILEDKRLQQIRKFELVEDLPITIGITLDTSGSMREALGEAKRSAIGFLDNIITPKDQSFAVSFASRPNLIMPRTSDVGAVEAALEGLQAVGFTSLYDAVITSLYYFRGVRGRRALVLLSDGEDSASTISFKDALEYARRSGVVIYSIGLKVRSAMGIRAKLQNFAQETGGRAFFISNSVELAGVYGAIERELRSQYLLAYLSDAPQASEQFRTVEVKVKGRLKARTISGYYP